MPAFKLEHFDSDTILHNKYGVYSKEELEAQLKEGHLTIDNLAELYRLKGYQMLHVLRVLKITYRNALNDTRIMSPEITPEMHQVLLGTLAGDAYMKHHKCYQLSHGPSQRAYL